MKTTFIFIGVLFSNITFTKHSYSEIHILLNLHCYDCINPSLEKYQQAVILLEEYLKNTNENIFYQHVFKLFFDKNIELILFYLSNDNKNIKLPINKQFQMAQYAMNMLPNREDIDMLVSSFEIGLNRLRWKAKQSDKDIIVYYNEKLLDLIKIKEKIYNEKKKKELIHMTFNEHLKRNIYLQSTDADKKLTIRYLEYIYFKEIFDKITRIYMFKLFLSYIKFNQLSKNEINELRRPLITLLGFNFTKEIYNIIWWCEVRSIDNKKEQLQFLNNQMLSTRKLDALKMLIELGEAETIEKWSKKLNFENSETIFKLSIKQAKLRQASIENDKHLAKLFTQELSQSITKIVKNKQLDDAYYQQHIRWLIIQIGTHKQDKKFKKILDNLAQDNLFYNRDLTKSKSKNGKKKLAEKIETKLKISQDAKFILNPEQS